MKTATSVKSAQVWEKLTTEIKKGDYIRLPYAPIVQVLDRYELPDSKVTLYVKTNAGAAEVWLVEPESAAPQVAGFAGDSISCQLRPSKATPEYEQGYRHGQQDAIEQLHPIYTDPTCSYAAGYAEGYNHIIRPTHFQSVENKQVEWKVTYDSNWDWYYVWVGERLAGKASNHEEAERLAQQYIATDALIKKQNAAVLAAWSK